MTPYLSDAIVRDRIATRIEQAEHQRVARAARRGRNPRPVPHPIRDAFGHGLIAIGVMLVDAPSNNDDILPRAA